MKFSIIKTPITPKLPCHIEGYHDRIATSIASELFCHSIAISSNQTIIFHSLDIIIITKTFADRIRLLIQKQFNVPVDNIVLTAIHTHSGPTVSNVVDPHVLPDDNYLDLLESVILKNTEYILSNLEDGYINFGYTKIVGHYSNRNDVNLYYNPDAYLLRFINKEKELKFSLVNLSCHPTVLNANNRSISSDFVGYMRNHYESLSNAPLVFFNGEAGDVSTRNLRKESTLEAARSMGIDIANQLLNINNNTPLEVDSIVTKKHILEIDYEPKNDSWLSSKVDELLKTIQKIDANDSQYWFIKNMKLKPLIDKLDLEKIEINAETLLFDFGSFRIVTIPGELVSEFGRKLHSVDSKPTLIFAYANNFNIYAVNIEQYGKYFESFNTMYPIGIADKMIDELIKLYK